MEQLIGQVLDNKYRIEKRLGQGGMGAVYLAVHIGTERPVALKVIIPQFMANQEFVERFKREARAAGRLRHPNVVNVTDFGFTTVNSDGIAYLVMEYLNGSDLGALLKRRERLPLAFIVDIVEQVCLAIDNAHRQGIIHRDLKPDNIWLEPNGRGGYNVKVLDFGLAKLRERPREAFISTNPESITEQPTEIVSPQRPSQAETKKYPDLEATKLKAPAATTPETTSKDASVSEIAVTEVALSKAATVRRQPDQTKEIPGTQTEENGGLTQAGAVLGTPLYMSPEQCLGNELDERSDIYSLGVIVYQMLARETPFKGVSHYLMAQHVEVPPPSLSEHCPEIPTQISTLVMQALEKEPSRRPANALAFSTAFRANAEGDISLLRQAIAIFSDYFSLFTKIALIAYTPMTVGILVFLLALLQPALHKPYYVIPIAIFFHLTNLFNNFVSGGIVVPIVTELLRSPLEPPDIRGAIANCRRHLSSFISTSLKNRAHQRYWYGVFLPMIAYSCLPNSIKTAIYSSGGYWVLLGLLTAVTLWALSFDFRSGRWLYAPVVILEEREGYEVFTRTGVLMERLGGSLGRTFPLLVFIMVDASMLVIMLGWLLISQFQRQLSTSEILLSIGTAAFGAMLSALLSILISPIIAISYALFYLKAKQAGGESKL